MSAKLIFFVVLFSVAVTDTTLAQSCPPAEELLPCTCNERLLRFHCSNPDTNLKVVFDRVSPLINDSVVFEDIIITGMGATEIPANTMVSLKFKKIYIEFNFNLAFIHADAFPGTYETTTELTIAENKLSNENDPYDIFNFVGKFTKVESVSMHHNNIRIIPDDPFTQLLPNLKYLRIGSGNFLDIGSRVFANLPSLEFVELSHCEISRDKLKNDTFEGIGRNAVVNLEYNPFSRVPEEIFKPVLDNAKELRVGGRDCAVLCFDILLDCDEQANWICENAAAYANKVVGFYCKDERDIWHYCQL